ncbi:antiterminator, partial [Leptospira borgpetersenii serovar Hardjo-bovis]|nr:antiterminator [Leptospira borgpetersenii serovar Hardjo-bovis]
AWWMWNYRELPCWVHCDETKPAGWSTLAPQLGAKKMAGKTQERLRALIWLAAQDVESELAGREVYQYKELAGLVGVSEKNWSETFTRHWLTMRAIFLRLDQASLLSVSESRSEQVAFNLYALN